MQSLIVTVRVPIAKPGRTHAADAWETFRKAPAPVLVRRPASKAGCPALGRCQRAAPHARLCRTARRTRATTKGHRRGAQSCDSAPPGGSLRHSTTASTTPPHSDARPVAQNHAPSKFRGPQEGAGPRPAKLPGRRARHRRRIKVCIRVLRRRGERQNNAGALPASRRVEVPSRHRRDSSSSEKALGGFLLILRLFRGTRRHRVSRRRNSRND